MGSDDEVGGNNLEMLPFHYRKRPLKQKRFKMTIAPVKEAIVTEIFL